MNMTQFTKLDIQEALERCLEKEPTINFCLSPDASQLAAILGEMNFFHQNDREINLLSNKQKSAFERWAA
jgi:hypothetical protein